MLLAAGVYLFAAAMKNVDLEKTIDEIREANIFWILVSIAVSLVAFASRAWRWNMLIHPLGYRPKFSNSMASLMIGYLANLALPRLGEVTRCASLNKSDDVPFEKLIGTVIVERIIDVLCLIVCIFITAIVEYDRLINFMNEEIFHPLKSKLATWMISPVFWLVIVGVIGVLTFVFVKYIKPKKSQSGQSKISKVINGVWDGLKSVKDLESRWAFLFHTILIWVMYYLMAYTCFFAMESTKDLTWQAGLMILVMGAMGMSAPVQGGIGAYHILVSKGLLLYGVSNGMAYALMMHTSQIIVVCVFGFAAIVYLMAFNRKKNENNRLHTV